ncbi:hydantoinase/oxoprolinase family protein [Kaarinaea lacus]
MIVLGVDTGGTFTDFVLAKDNQIRIHKVLSTPQAPEKAILQGMQELGLEQTSQEPLCIIHGSTVATNAVLEGKGVRTAYICNRGLSDVLTIGRQARRELYNLQPSPNPVPVPEELCLATGGRLSAAGDLIEPLTDADLERLQQQLQKLAPHSVAINLLFSFLDDSCEQRIAAIVPPHMFVSCSSQVLPETKEYERGIATWLNASVGPIVEGYLNRLLEGVSHLTRQHKCAPSVSVMQSSGGTIAAKQAGREAVQLLLSGPAGGLAGAKFVAATSGQLRLLSFDMGGTSTDVALIDGEIVLTTEGHIGDYPVGVPMVDMHTIGAGGGSIASVDAGGLLQVGPQSAGADPGPACYGKGAGAATVTDANVVLGRLRPELFLGGRLTLDSGAAHNAIASLGQQLSLDVETTAQGIIEIVNEHMARALRVMSVQRGIDPKELTLVPFGGAGGLHVCALAEALNMNKAIVPVYAGVLSALGMLVAPKLRLMSRSVNLKFSDLNLSELQQVFSELINTATQALLEEGVSAQQLSVERSVDMRYLGQSYSLNLAWQTPELSQQNFHRLHQQRYGHSLEQPVELVTARVKVSAPVATLPLTPIGGDNTPAPLLQTITLPGVDTAVNVYNREYLRAGDECRGPALICETVSTTYVAPGWWCRVDPFGNLMLQTSP